jgi:hypothetical protein
MKRFPILGQESSGSELTRAGFSLLSKVSAIEIRSCARFRFIWREIQGNFVGTFPIYPDFFSAGQYRQSGPSASYER